VPRAGPTGSEYRSRRDHILALNAASSKLHAFGPSVKSLPSVVIYVEVRTRAPPARCARYRPPRQQRGCGRNRCRHGTGRVLQHELDARACRLGMLGPFPSTSKTRLELLSSRRGWRLSSRERPVAGRYQLDCCGPGCAAPLMTRSDCASQPSRASHPFASLVSATPERIMAASASLSRGRTCVGQPYRSLDKLPGLSNCSRWASFARAALIRPVCRRPLAPERAGKKAAGIDI